MPLAPAELHESPGTPAVAYTNAAFAGNDTESIHDYEEVVENVVNSVHSDATYDGDTYSDMGSAPQSGNYLEPVPTGNANGIVYATYAPTALHALGGQPTAYSGGLPALDVPGPYSAADPRTEPVAYSDGLPALNTAGPYSLPDPLDGSVPRQTSDV